MPGATGSSETGATCVPPAPDETTCAEQFAVRHIGPDADARTVMLTHLGYESLVDLVDAAVPASNRDPRPLNLPPARSEQRVPPQPGTAVTVDIRGHRETFTTTALPFYRRH